MMMLGNLKANNSANHDGIIFQIVNGEIVQPLLIAAGGGGASDTLGALESPNAKGFLPEELSMHQILQMIPRDTNDAGKGTFRLLRVHLDYVTQPCDIGHMTI